jgi:hypothetical protein
MLPKQFCVLYSIPDGSRWFDAENEVAILFFDGGAEYWINGRRGDAACTWRLKHCRHDIGRCVFKCDAPNAEWFVSVTNNANGEKAVCLDKNVSSRTLPVTYHFSRAAK